YRTSNRLVNTPPQLAESSAPSAFGFLSCRVAILRSSRRHLPVRRQSSRFRRRGVGFVKRPACRAILLCHLPPARRRAFMGLCWLATTSRKRELWPLPY